MKGRLIRVLNRTSAQVKAGEVRWDRTDANGRRAAPGLYIIMNRTGNTVVRKVMCQ